MTASVECTAPGALALVQDAGRSGWRRFGVPRAGALQPQWWRIANRLAGNADDAPAIEFFVAGPSFTVRDAPLRFGCAGDFTLTVTRHGERSVLDGWRSVTLQPGDSLQAGPPRHGRVGYLSIAGLQVPRVLGSAATYTRARLGGIAGRALAAGDVLQAGASPTRLLAAPLSEAHADTFTAPERLLRRPPQPVNAPIRVVLGPQDDFFDAETITAFLAAEYRISRDADRMGLRLEGLALGHRPDKGAEIVSDAALPGSIQVPGNGLPIVLLADGQTVGGYPKIATVVSADLPRLAVAAVGAGVRFQAVSVAQAEGAARAADAQLRQMLADIAPLTLVDGIDLDAIYASNLVSGMIDASDPPS